MNNKKRTLAAHSLTMLIVICLFFGGCHFEGMYHRINDNVEDANAPEIIEMSDNTARTIENETTTAPDATEESTLTAPSTTETGTQTVSTSAPATEPVTQAITEAITEPVTAEPTEMSYIDIFDSFRFGTKIDQISVTKHGEDAAATVTYSGVKYVYGACTDFLSREDLGDFFYSGDSKYQDNLCNAFVYEYTDSASQNLLRRRPLLLSGNRAVYHFSPDCGAIRITFAFLVDSVKENRQSLTEDILRAVFRISPASEVNLYKKLNAGQPDLLKFLTNDAEQNTDPGVANLLARARQISSIQYRITSGLPVQTTKGYIPPIEEDGSQTVLSGLPYSSARSNDKILNINVTTYTFLTALYNPRSVLYTRYLESSNAETFYGTVCSAFTDYAHGFRWNLPTQFLNSDRFSSAYYKKPIEEAVIGDVIINSNHMILISNIYRNHSGDIVMVEYTHAIPPLVISTTAVYSRFLKKVADEGYECFGYRGVSAIPYERNPYVVAKEGETVEPIAYPDIMCEFGDKAVLMGGGSTAAGFERQVTVNVLNTEGYSSIQIYRDSVHPIDYERTDRDYVLLETRYALEDFVLGNARDGLVPGAYKIVMRGPRKTSSTEFFVVDAVCLYEEGKLYWRSSNAEADIVFLYTDYPVCEPVILGQTNVSPSERPGYDYCMDLNQRRAITEAARQGDFRNAKIIFRTQYGTAAWYSYFNSDWIERIGD